MCVFTLGFVAFTKTNQIRGHHAMAAGQKNGNHLAIKIAPSRVAVQAEISRLPTRPIHPALIKIVHPQPLQRWQIADVMRCPRVVGQARKLRIGRAQCVFSKRMVHLIFRLGVAAAGSKKALQQFTALGCQHAALDCGLVIELMVTQHIKHRACGAGFRVSRAKYDALQPRMQHRASAHGAGFQRDKQLATVQAVVAQHARRLS